MSEGFPLSAFEQVRYDAAKAASDQARALGLAGIAIVWLFAGPFFQGKTESGPSDVLYFAGAALALALALDMAQLVGRALLLDAAYMRVERRPEIQAAVRQGKDPQVDDIGTAVHRVTRALFLLKIAALGVGYGAILVFFAGKL